MTKPRQSRQSRAAPAVTVTDSLRNVIANLGTGRDKAASSVYAFCPRTDPELISAYRGSWLPRAIVDIPAEDSVRKWREWKADPEQITLIDQVEARLGVKRKLEQAIKMARLLGGSAIYIQTNERNPSRPMTPDSVQEIRGLTVLTKMDLTPGPIVRDIENTYYGKPEIYKLSRQDGQPEVEIHASRLVVLDGNMIPHGVGFAGYRDTPLHGAYSEGWGDSVLQSVLEVVTQHDSSVANIASLIFEAKINVFKFEGFSEQLMQNKGGAVTNRLSLQAAHKGINGDVVIDMKDDFQQRTANFGGLDSLLERFGYLVAGAAEIPATRLFGRSSAGLSGSGDGDERVYFDRINHEQTLKIGPAMELLDECIIRVALGSRPPEVWYEWRPLRQVSEQERAEIFSKTATAARALAGANAGEIIPLDALSDALVNELTEQGVLPGLEVKIAEYGSLGEQGEEGEDERETGAVVE